MILLLLLPDTTNFRYLISQGENTEDALAKLNQEASTWQSE
jgi:hypothetical protein